MKNKRAKFRKNANKQEVEKGKKFKLEDILAADLSNDGALFMLFILILLIGSIFYEEEVLWIMAVVLFVEMISKRKVDIKKEKSKVSR